MRLGGSRDAQNSSSPSRLQRCSASQQAPNCRGRRSRMRSHADAHHFAVQLGKRVAVVGKQGKLARRFGAVGEGFDGAHPAGALAVVELAEVQQMALDHASAAHATAFDDAPVAVLFAVFVAGPRAQEHGSSLNL